MKNLRSLSTALALSGATTSFAAIVSADFATYANGNLAGQNSWAQYNTSTTNPIQVVGGKVTWAGIADTVVNDQDAFLPFASVIEQPADGTTLVYLALQLAVSSAAISPDSPSFFAALNANNTSVTSNNFQNARLVAINNGGTFDFGARVNGQTGYPFAYGNEGLEFGTTYNLVARISLVFGNSNDLIELFVADAAQPFTFDNVYATAAFLSGTVTDPTYGALVLSQFANATTTQSGVSINKLLVTKELSEVQSFVGSAIPEPSTYSALLGGLALCLGAVRRRRRA